MTFTLTIELGNDAMQDSADIRSALAEVRRQLLEAKHWIHVSKGVFAADGAKILDANGNSVGQWEVK